MIRISKKFPILFSHYTIHYTISSTGNHIAASLRAGITYSENILGIPLGYLCSMAQRP